MWLSQFIFILLAIKLIKNDPLDKNENEQRLNSCGKSMKSKVYMGREVKQSEAPWSVFFLFKSKTENGAEICTGSVVSSRHIFIATHCFAALSDDGIWKIDGKFDRSNCQKDHYVIKDKDILNRIGIQSDSKYIARFPDKVTLLNACIKREANQTKGYPKQTPQLYIDDFAIIDLYEELTFSDTLQMVCVADDISANSVDTKLDYYGFGLNPPKGVDANDAVDNSGVLRHEVVQIKNEAMEDYYFRASNPEHKTIACFGDSGGGGIAKINGRKTIVGVVSQTNCAKSDQRETKTTEQYSSVGYYSTIICELTGICKDSQSYDQFHKGYVKKVKRVRVLEDDQSNQGVQDDYSIPEGWNIDKRRPDGSMNYHLNFILFSMIFVIYFY